MLRSFSLFLYLLLFWLLLSGFFTAFLVSAGVVSALAVLWFSRRMDGGPPASGRAHMGLRVITYGPWLLKEIAKSAWSVSRIILDPRLPISPTLVSLKPSQRTEVGLVLHANSITLTPGTITIEAGPDEFLVHGITLESAQGAVGSEMDRRIAAGEGRP